MRKQFFLLLVGLSTPALTAGIAASGCGSVIEIDTEGDGGIGGDAKPDGKHTSSGSWGKDSGPDVLPDYVDPGCPDAGPPITKFECDPFNQVPGNCPKGEGCYIFVQYPSEPCDKEIYGATCAPVGPGGQGSACQGAQDCGAGFCCVVSGSGNQCIQLCKLVGDDGCPPGLVCEPIDVEGFGGCL